MNRIEIITERLILKPLGTEHFQTAKEYSMDYENTKYMCRLPHETSEETMAFLSRVEAEWKKEKPEYYEFAILYEGKHIGAVSIYFENGAGELGWILNKSIGETDSHTKPQKPLSNILRQTWERRISSPIAMRKISRLIKQWKSSA